jgi:hypothetical protein
VADPIAPFAPSLSELGIDVWERVGLQVGQLNITHLTSLRRSMNMVLVRWASRGINLWKVAPVTVPLLPNVATYALDPTVLDVLDTYRRVTVGGINTDILMSQIGRDTYAALPNKAQIGSPNQFLYERLLTPQITVWPVPDTTTTYTLVFYAFSQIADADPAGGAVGQLPYRFTEAFAAGTAAHLAQKWASTERAVALDAYADKVWAEASDADTESVVLTMAPDLSEYYR